MSLTPAGKYVILSALIDGEWIETQYEVSDPLWKEAIRVFSDLHVSFRLAYK